MNPEGKEFLKAGDIVQVGSLMVSNSVSPQNLQINILRLDATSGRPVYTGKISDFNRWWQNFKINFDYWGTDVTLWMKDIRTEEETVRVLIAGLNNDLGFQSMLWSGLPPVERKLTPTEMLDILNYLWNMTVETGGKPLDFFAAFVPYYIHTCVTTLKNTGLNVSYIDNMIGDKTLSLKQSFYKRLNDIKSSIDNYNAYSAASNAYSQALVKYNSDLVQWNFNKLMNRSLPKPIAPTAPTPSSISPQQANKLINLFNYTNGYGSRYMPGVKFNNV